MITIYLGDVTRDLADLAISADPQAQLVNHTNYQNLTPGTYFTSLGDVKDLRTLSLVLNQANVIVYAPPTKWSDEHKGVSAMCQWYNDYLNVYKFRCTVKNFFTTNEFDNIALLIDNRKTPHPQLWVAGCSISHGDGVTKQTRYGQLLSEHLNLEVSFLTRGGSSLAWAADQILRSDIKENDLVVWGLTSYRRFSRFNKNKMEYINASTPFVSKTLIDFMDSDHTLYQSVTSVLQVINFCKKVKAHLILASLLDTVVVNYLPKNVHLVMLADIYGRDTENTFFDLGTDKIHPGPITHQFYAKEIYKKVKQINF